MKPLDNVLPITALHCNIVSKIVTYLNDFPGSARQCTPPNSCSPKQPFIMSKYRDGKPFELYCDMCKAKLAATREGKNLDTYILDTLRLWTAELERRQTGSYRCKFKNCKIHPDDEKEDDADAVIYDMGPTAVSVDADDTVPPWEKEDENGNTGTN